jgi:hypothetical protein
MVFFLPRAYFTLDMRFNMTIIMVRYEKAEICHILFR